MAQNPNLCPMIVAKNPNPPHPGKVEEEPHSAILITRLCLFVISFPIIVWTFLLLLDHERQQQYNCESLLDDPLGSQWVAIFLLTLLLLLSHVFVSLFNIPVAQETSGYEYRNKLKILWLQMLFFVCFIGIMFFIPVMGDKSLFGVFGSSSSSQSQTFVQSGNHSRSLYWDTNIKSCVCTTPTCEESVYWGYMNGMAYSGDAATQIFGNGNKGDLQIFDESPRYHEVCYSDKLWNNGERKTCYNCYGCEEQFLRGLQENMWAMWNVQYVQTLLLVVANVVALMNELLDHVRGR